MRRCIFLLLTGCAFQGPTLVDVVETHPSQPPIPPAMECTVITARQPARSADHVAPCAPLDFSAQYPPASGMHYAVWADFRTYDRPVPWGYLLHSMEHGAVVLAYNCPSGCPDILAAYQRAALLHSDDPLCRPQGEDSRMIIVPDPELPTPIAAVSWEHLYTATCLDEASLTTFVAQNYGRGRENICFAGEINPTCP